MKSHPLPLKLSFCAVVSFSLISLYHRLESGVALSKHGHSADISPPNRGSREVVLKGSAAAISELVLAVVDRCDSGAY